MGKNAVFVKARAQDERRRRAKRQQRSKAERGRRLAWDDRRIRHVARQWALPTAPDAALLLAQFAQSCRLPGASAGLCALIRHGEGAALAEMVSGLLRAQDESTLGELGDEEADAPATILQDILQNECGVRVVTTLLEALSATESGKDVAKAILEQFEASEGLVTHHVACRVLTALVQWGPMEVKCGVLELLRERNESASDGSTVKLLKDRHAATTIVELLKHLPLETHAWLDEALGFGEGELTDTKAVGDTAARTGKENEESTSVGEGGLYDLIEHPVSWRILAKFALHMPVEKRLRLLNKLSLSELSQHRQGSRFLIALLSVDSGEEKEVVGAASAAAIQMLKEVVEKSAPLLQEISKIPHGNFFVQQLIQFIPFVCGANKKDALELFSRVVRALGHNGGPEVMRSLALHPIGVHVICKLTETAFSLISSSSSGSGGSNYHIVEEIASFLTTPKQVSDVICDQYGSLFVRHLMPLIKQKQSKLGKMLDSTIMQMMNSFIYDLSANMVVQEYFKNVSVDAASKFTNKLMEEEVLAMSKNPYASYVLFTLLDVISPASRTGLCSILKPHVLDLATHVNGRFIVERLVATSREVRDELVRQFYVLAKEKGTQHVLCSLVSYLDPRGKVRIIEEIILPRLFELATHSYGTIVLQELMQSDPGITTAVKKKLEQESTLRNNLAQNFYGKFVVQIAES